MINISKAKQKAFLFLLILLPILLPAAGLSQNIGKVDDYAFAVKLFQEGLFQPSVSKFRQFIHDNPTDERISTAQYKIGEAYYRLGKFREALEELRTFWIKYPDSPSLSEGWFLFGRTLENLGRKKEAAEKYMQGGKFFFPDNALASESFLRAGKIYFNLNMASQAYEAFDYIRMYYPGSSSYPEALYYLGRIAYGRNEFKTAKTLLQNAVNQAKSTEIKNLANAEIGAINLFEGKVQSGIEMLLSIYDSIQESDAKARIRHILIDFYTKNENYSTAVNFIDNIATYPEKLDNIKAITATFIGLKQYARGTDICRELMTKDLQPQEKVLVVTELSKLYEAEGNPAGAADLLENFFESSGFEDETTVPVIVRLSELARKYNFLEKAERYYDILIKKGLVQNPDYILLDLGKLYLKNSQYDKAINLFSKAVIEFPASKIIDNFYYNLGVAYERKEQYQNAYQIYNQLLKLYPSSDFQHKAEENIAMLEMFRPVFGINDIFDFEMDFLVKEKLLEKNGISESVTGEQLRQIVRFYFEKRKDYPRVISLAGTIESAESDSFLLDITAESYERLSKQSFSRGDSAAAHEYLNSARGIYTKMINAAVPEPLLSFARLRLAEIDIRQTDDPDFKIENINSYYEVLLDNSYFRDKVLYSYAQNMYVIADDSAITQGNGLLERLVREYPESIYAPEALETLAKENFLAGDFINSRKYAELYIGKYPAGPAISPMLFTGGKAAYEMNDPADGITYFNRLINDFQYSSYSDSANMIIGDFYLKAGEFEKALRRFQAVLLKPKPSVELYYSIAVTYDSLKNYGNALTYYFQYIERVSTQEQLSKAHFAIGNLYFRLKEQEEAVQHYGEVVKLNIDQPYKITAKERLADLSFRIGDYELAELSYNDLFANEEDKAKKVIWKAQEIVCMYRQADISKGDAEVRKFESTYKNIDESELREYKALFRFENGFAKETSGRKEQALTAYRDVETNFANSDAAFESKFRSGIIFLQTRRMEDALDVLTALPQKKPDSPLLPAIYNTLGQVYSSIERPEDAFFAFKRAAFDTTSSGLDPVYLINFINSCQFVGFYDEQIRAARLFIDRFPQSKYRYNADRVIAMAYYHLGQYPRAIQELRKLLGYADGEEEMSLQYYIADSYFSMENYSSALAEYLKILLYGGTSKIKWKTNARNQIAKCYTQLGQLDKAIKYYQEIIRFEGANSMFGRDADKQIKILQEKK